MLKTRGTNIESVQVIMDNQIHWPIFVNNGAGAFKEIGWKVLSEDIIDVMA